MTCYDDFHGVWMTICSAMLHHPEVKDRVRFVIVDNNPGSKHGEETNKHFAKMRNVDYHTVSGVSSTSFRNLVFELARTPYVLCLDCHVLLQPKALERLIRFYTANPNCHDLLHGPLYNESGHVVATHMLPSWRGGNFGVWDTDSRALDPKADPVEIPMHGMGLFACSREGWPRFTAGMRGFGAEEGTIHEKFRLMGRKAWCLPFLGWLHRFGRPDGPKYPNSNEMKIRNYLLTFTEMHLPIDTIVQYWRPKMGEQKIQELVDWSKTLPKPSLAKPPGYVPFLGQPIRILKDD